MSREPLHHDIVSSCLCLQVGRDMDVRIGLQVDLRREGEHPLYWIQRKELSHPTELANQGSDRHLFTSSTTYHRGGVTVLHQVRSTIERWSCFRGFRYPWRGLDPMNQCPWDLQRSEGNIRSEVASDFGSPGRALRARPLEQQRGGFNGARNHRSG